ncbi:hypothetical protein B4U80_12565, partial [Leptotrombidium deliense]
MCSADFPDPDVKQCWFLKLRPFVTDDNGEEHIGIHLFLKNAAIGDVVRAWYEIAFLDVKNNRRYVAKSPTTAGNIFKRGEEGHGFRQVVPRSDLNLKSESNQSPLLLGFNDSLKIFCKIVTFGKLKSELMLTPSSPARIYTTKELDIDSIANDFSKLSSSILTAND